MLHIGAEDRLADHPQGHPRHVGAQVHGAPVGERPPAVHGLGPLLHDHRDVVAHGLVREQGLHLPLLALPHVAVGRQQPVAEELSELDIALVALVEIVGPGGQDVLDHVRVEEEGGLPVVLAGGTGKADDIAELEHCPVRRTEQILLQFEQRPHHRQALRSWGQRTGACSNLRDPGLNGHLTLLGA